MAWTIETFAGRKANGATSDWRTAMFELCRAVNQRQVAAGYSQTLFYKANGTQSAVITMDDLLGMKTSRPTSYVETNLKRIQAAIKTMATPLAGENGFLQGTGNSAEWTVAELETAIGSTFRTAPESAIDTPYWQQLKDALDLLIYVKREVNVLAVASTSYYNFNVGGPYNDTFQEAWDYMLGSGTGSSLGATNVRLYGARYGVNRDTRCRFGGGCTVNFPYLGTLTLARYGYLVVMLPSSVVSATMDLLAGTTAISSPTANGYVDAEPGDLSLGSNSFSFGYSVPATYPMASPSLGQTYTYSVELKTAVACFDLASVLTDQA